MQKVSLIQVRYNTESDGKNLCWRLLADGEEMLVNGIIINKACHTTTDWLEDKQCFKHHITINDCTIEVHPETLIAKID